MMTSKGWNLKPRKLPLLIFRTGIPNMCGLVTACPYWHHCIAGPLIGHGHSIRLSYWLHLTGLSHLQFLTLTIIPHTDTLTRQYFCYKPSHWSGVHQHCPLICWLWPDHPHCARHLPQAFLWSLGEKKFWCGKKSGLNIKTYDLTTFRCAGVNLEAARNSSAVFEISQKLSYNSYKQRGLHPHWDLECGSDIIAVMHYCKYSRTAESPSLSCCSHKYCSVYGMGLSINVDQ